MLFAVTYHYTNENTHFGENRSSLPPLGHVWWVLKSHMRDHKPTNCSTCAILFQRVQNVSAKSEALPSRFVTYKQYNNNNININNN